MGEVEDVRIPCPVCGRVFGLPNPPTQIQHTYRECAAISAGMVKHLQAQLQKAQEWREKAEKVVEAARKWVGKAKNSYENGESKDCYHHVLEALSALETGKEKAP